MIADLAHRWEHWCASCDFPEGTYTGARALLLPPDLLLSWLAKRSYGMYRAWDAWAGITKPAYPPRKSRRTASPEQFEATDHMLHRLCVDGFVPIPDAFPHDWVEEAREFVLDRYRSSLAKMHALGDPPEVSATWYDEDGVHVHCSPRQGRFRFGFPRQPERLKHLPQSIADFVRLPVTQQIVESYFGMAVSACRPYCIGEVLVDGPEVQSWHIDCLRRGIKAMLYLTGVSEAHGPLRYVPGSHSPGCADHPYIYRAGRYGVNEPFSDMMSDLYDGKATIVTGSANTLVLFDDRGIHAGSRCTEGVRVALVNGIRPAASTRINPALIPNIAQA